MIRLFYFFLLLMPGLVIPEISAAQPSKAVQWTFTSQKITDQLYEVRMDAKVNGNWHIYSQDGGEGPFSTTFIFTQNPLLNMDGKVQEIGTLKKVFEEAFGSEVRYYERSVSFVQKVKLRGKAKTNLAGKVEYMVCNDKQCLPPAEVSFSVNVGG
ncbi:MAG: hypothetical protein JNL51_07645 [Chitinophagaceae bacterium]|nr:hypothetical protein [Chitinophagaceae bacterium]